MINYIFTVTLIFTCHAYSQKFEHQPSEESKLSFVNKTLASAKSTVCKKGGKCISCCNEKHRTCAWPLTLEGKPTQNWVDDNSSMLVNKIEKAFSEKKISVNSSTPVYVASINGKGDLKIFATTGNGKKIENIEIVQSLSQSCSDELEKCRKGCQ